MAQQPQWEYCQVWASSPVMGEGICQKKAAEGWRMIGVVVWQGAHLYYYFEREINGKKS